MLRARLCRDRRPRAVFGVLATMFLFATYLAWPVGRRGVLRDTIPASLSNREMNLGNQSRPSVTEGTRCGKNAPLLKILLECRLNEEWPPKFLHNYKNPCWIEKSSDTRTMKCLPYTMLLGVAKSGTTNLYDQLIKHPDIVPPDHKEGVYFQQRALGLTMEQNLNYSFAKATQQISSQEDQHNYHKKITVDANPLVFTSTFQTWPIDRGVQPEPACTMSHNIQGIVPGVKLIVVLREPILRLFSHFRHLTAEAIPSAELFHQRTVEAVTNMKKCIQERSLRSCAFDQKIDEHLLYTKKLPLLSSMYYPYAAEFLSVFPRKQVLFLKAEEFYGDAARTMSEVFSFLELDPAPQEVLNSIQAEMKEWNDRKESWAKIGVEYSAVIWEETKTVLNDFFGPLNKKLADLLTDEKWLFA